MKQGLLGVALSLSFVIAGCGSQPSGTLEVIENGTYDVSGYSQVVVNVGGDDLGKVAAEEGVPESLNLVRTQFKGLSMEVPAELVEGYTEAELTENNMIILSDPEAFSGNYANVSISRSEMSGLDISLDQFTDAPQEDINGTVMAIRHIHGGDMRRVEVQFIANDSLYNVTVSYSMALDSLFSDYSEQFYRSIQIG